MTPDATRKLFEELSRHAWALSAVGVAAQRGLLAKLALAPATIDELADAGGLDLTSAAAIVDVIVAAGLASKDGDRVALDEGMRAYLVDAGAEGPGHDAIATLAGAAAPLRAAAEKGARVGGWPADDRLAVRAQGRLSGAATRRMVGLFDAIPGLRDRISRPGASLLDIGAGAAGLCVAFAQTFPDLRVIGIEPSAAALVEARATIAAAGLGSRIALRQQLGEDLDDDGLHTVAWVAQMFVPDDAIDGVWRATLRALEFGGVLLTLAVAQGGDDFFSAITRWRNAAWGGGVRTPDRVIAQLQSAGFVDVVAMPGPPGGYVQPIVARRPTP